MQVYIFQLRQVKRTVPTFYCETDNPKRNNREYGESNVCDFGDRCRYLWNSGA